MFGTSRIMDNLYDFLKSREVVLNPLTDASIDGIQELIRDIPCNIWISNLQALGPVYVNDYGREYHRLPDNRFSGQGYDFIQRIIHADDLERTQETIDFFRSQPNGVNRGAFRVVDPDGGWRWVFTFTRALDFDGIGRPIHVLAAMFDVEHHLKEPLGQRLTRWLLPQQSDELTRFQTLSPREKEVLSLIAQEYTSQEVAGALNIHTTTVDTHRKRIIRKLDIKSSYGMVRYYVKYAEGDAGCP